MGGARYCGHEYRQDEKAAPVGSHCRAGNPEASEFYFKGKGRVLTVFSAPLAAMWDKPVGASAEARTQEEAAQSTGRPRRGVRNTDQ